MYRTQRTVINVNQVEKTVYFRIQSISGGTRGVVWVNVDSGVVWDPLGIVWDPLEYCGIL